MEDIYFWRQCFVLSAGLLYSVCVGFTLAFPSVLNPAITSDNTTDIITSTEHASWIAAINGIGGIFGSIGLSPIMQIFGRKACHYSINAFLLIGWMIFPFAKSITALYIARFVQGISIGNVFINSIIICEYIHPKRRGYFITLKKVTIALGTLCCHAMGAVMSWRRIAMFAAVPPFLSIILTLFWPESPSFLALRGRFQECEKSFKWLNGNTEESQAHLKSLVEARIKKMKSIKRENRLKELMLVFVRKDFQKAFLVSSVLTLSVDVCGRYYFIAYVSQIMTELLGNKTSVMYFTLGADVFTIIALLLSTVVVSYVKRRTILFSSGVTSVVLMLAISLLVYLSTVYTFSTYFLWFSAFVVILQSFVVNVGLVPMSFTLVGEIFPLENKGMGSCTSGIVFTVLYAVSLKATPVLMEHTGLYGTYGIYGVILALCLVYLGRNLPETKDKTLQDIEDELNDVEQNAVLKEKESLVSLN